MGQWGLTAVLAVCAAVVVFVLVTVAGGGSGDTRRATATDGPFAAYTAREPHVLSGSSLYSLSRRRRCRRIRSSFPPASRRRSRSTAPTRSPSSGRCNRGSRLSGVRWRRTTAPRRRTPGAPPTPPICASAPCTCRAGRDPQPGDRRHANGLEGGVSNPRFAGLHKIEYGLWSGAAPRSLVGTADQLEVAVRKLRDVLPGASITPLEYATRAHEILEDAQRDLLSGADVPWSGEGPLGTRPAWKRPRR